MVGLRNPGDIKMLEGDAANKDANGEASEPVVEKENRFNSDLVKFDGNFECANIEQVRRRDGKTYDVWMRNDSNGTGLLQWFYFRMKN